MPEHFYKELSHGIKKIAEDIILGKNNSLFSIT